MNTPAASSTCWYCCWVDKCLNKECDNINSSPCCRIYTIYNTTLSCSRHCSECRKWMSDRMMSVLKCNDAEVYHRVDECCEWNMHGVRLLTCVESAHE